MKSAFLSDGRRSLCFLLNKLAGVKGEFFWIIAGQAMALVSGLVGVKLLTNMMPQAAYGQLALGLSIVGLINMFLFGPLGQVILRYYSVSGERGEHAVYSILLRRLHRQTVLFIVVVGLAVSAVVHMTAGTMWAYLTMAAVCFGVVSGLLGSVQALFSAARERKLTALSQSADALLRLLLAVLLITFASREGYWVLAGYSLGSLCVLLFQLRHLHRMMPYIKAEKAIDTDAVARYFDEFKRFGMPFVAFAGFAVISQYADRWLLQGLVGAEEVGIYAVLYQIASAPIALLAGIVNQLIIPVVFARAGALTHSSQIERSRHWLKLTQMGMAAAFVVAILGAVIWGKPLVTWLANESYAIHAEILWVLALGLAMFHLAQLMVAEGLSCNSSARYFWPKIAQGLILLFSGYALTYVYGLVGMAAAFALSSAAYYLIIVKVNMIHYRRNGATVGTMD